MVFRSQYDAIAAQRSEQARHTENTGRLGLAVQRFETDGWGEFKFEEAIQFEFTFTEKPAIMYGYEVVDGGDMLGEIDDVAVPGVFARSWGGVYEWLQDAKGDYTGALVFAVVDVIGASYSPTQATVDPGYQLVHCFTFLGDAYKGFQSFLGSPGVS